jgi:membrane protein
MQALDITKQALNKAIDDKVFRLAAALSYYSIFSLAPLLLIVIAVVGAVYGEEAANGVLASQLSSAIGASAAEAVQEMVVRTRTTSTNVFASVAGVVLMIVGATGVFAELQDALNTVWGIRPKPGRVVLSILRDRFRSFAMILGIGFLLLTSLVLTTTLQLASDWLARLLHIPSVVWSLLANAIAFVVVTALFAAIYKVLPDAKIAWRDVRFGATVTAVLFVLGRFVLGWYLGREATTSVYGSAASVVLILLWVNYSSLILFFGAELTLAHARSRGRDIRPNRRAEAFPSPTRPTLGRTDAT